MFFPRDTSAKQFSLQFTDGNQLLHFPFLQTLIDTRPARQTAQREWHGP